MEEKSIDIVREKLKKRREEAETPEEKRGLDGIIEMVNENDFFFLTIPVKTAAKIFSLLDLEDDQVRELYRDLISVENQMKFDKYQMEQKKSRVVSIVNKFLKNKKNTREDDDDDAR